MRIALLLWCEGVEVRGDLEADDGGRRVGVVLGAGVDVVDHGGRGWDGGSRLRLT